MEELLNKLIEKGWKPRGFEKIYNFGIANGYTVLNTKKANYVSFATSCVFREDYGEEQKMDYVSYTYRQLVSKESLLWQFVCENDMADDGQRVFKLFDMRGYRHKTIFDDTCEYWLMQSALKDESELEDFLLQSIRVEGK